MKLRKILLPLFSSFLLTILCGCDWLALRLRPPTNLKVTLSASKANIVDLIWEGVDGANFYWVSYGHYKDSPYVYYSRDITSTNCSIPLSESGTYYFWVRSALYTEDDYRSSYFSKVASLDFTVETLEVPSNLTAKASESTLNTVDLAWDEVDRASYYQVLYNTKNSSSDASTWTFTDSTACSVSPYKTGTYYFWVKSCSTASETKMTDSEPSAVASFYLEHKDLVAPTDLKAQLFPSGIYLSWTSTQAPYYHIYCSTTNRPPSETRDFCRGIKDTNYVYPDKYFTAGTTYYFWVKSSDHYYRTDSSSGFSKVAIIYY